MTTLVDKINTAIRWSFYVLFFSVPLIMWPDTYELFEFNKMWVVFAISLFIFFLWATKMILEGKIEIRRTPLDIPIALFLISQIISTIISIDPHVSLWGYYSRFNGGFLSIIAYIFLYYAFATNLVSTDPERKPISYKLLVISLLSGFVVTLWGLPSHFGIDFTCFMFRGSADVACWTEAFQPTIRIFSTLGQPNWLGTYLAALIPIALGFGLFKLSEKNKLIPIIYLLVSSIYFLALLWTRSQSSFLGLTVSLIIFISIFIYHHFIKTKQKANFSNETVRFLIIFVAIFALITFFIGTPIESLNKFTTLSGIKNLANRSQVISHKSQVKSDGLEGSTNIAVSGGTESSKIRLIVWQGAIELFKRNPITGSGVETFAYAYYGVKPLAHNLTSEWDYLYNKAHNEYLNYLATTGAAGLGSYLLIIVFFLYRALRALIKNKGEGNFPILLGIAGGYIVIIISNFFGFSVVVINLFFFFFPIFFFELDNPKVFSSSFAFPRNHDRARQASLAQMAAIVIVAIIVLFSEFYLLNFWLADRKYAAGYNLNKAGEYAAAYTPLSEAVKMAPGEDLYQDELSVNLATLALLLNENNQSTQAAQLAQEARALSDAITTRHPHNIIFYKTRTKVAFVLSEIDPSYLDVAIDSIRSARRLAPTDAKLAYNTGLFYNQKADFLKTEENFLEAIRLKPNYIDAYYALALLYSEQARVEPQRAIEYKSRARKNLEFVLKNLDSQNSAVRDLLKSL